MTPDTRGALAMTGVILVMCGAVIAMTEPLRRRRRELEDRYQGRER